MPSPYYDQDGIQIFHGDCREILPGLEFDVVVTDPPYGVSWRQPRKCKGRMSIQGDDAWTFPRPSVPFVVWGANNSPEDYSDCGWLVWDKERYGTDLHGDGELAAISEGRKVRVFGGRWNRQHRAGWTGLHPTEKPVGLLRWAMHFLPDGVVCDPFTGSGSALVAAKRLAPGVLPFGS